MKTRRLITISIALLLMEVLHAQSDTLANGHIKMLINRSIENSYQIKIKDAQIKKAQLDKKKALDAYLPKVTAEGSYTCLNEDVVFPEDMQQLLTHTQMLLVKEQVTMQMQQNQQLPAAYRSTFGLGTSYTADAQNPNSASSILAAAVQQNVKEIPPIQERNIWKANVSAQMLVFSGMKVPYSIKAANHQIKALEMISENEKSVIIKDVVTTYDKLAVLTESEKVLNTTEKYLNEQERLINKAIQNGLAIELQKKKIELSRQQLKYKRIELNNNRKLVYAKLEELSGISEDSIAIMQPILAIYPLTSLDASAEDRLDMQALSEAITATKYKRMSEMTNYVPKVVIFGKKELYTDDLSMFDPEWLVGASIRWTIFDGGMAINASRQAKLDKYVLEQKKAEAEDLINLNLKRLRLEVEKNNEQLSVSEKQIELAEKMHELSKKQYETGLITLNEYLTSVNDLEQAHLDNIKAIYQQRTTAIEFLAASGKLINSYQL